MKCIKCGQPAFQYNGKIYQLCALCGWQAIEALAAETQWYDVEDHSPLLVCEVKLSDGRIVEAHYSCGSWETVEEGEWIQPIMFRPKETMVITALYKPPFDLT